MKKLIVTNVDDFYTIRPLKIEISDNEVIILDKIKELILLTKNFKSMNNHEELENIGFPKRLDLEVKRRLQKFSDRQDFVIKEIRLGVDTRKDINQFYMIVEFYITALIDDITIVEFDLEIK